MAIIGMISEGPAVTGDFKIGVVAVFFDDADAANEGYVHGHEPRNVLYQQRYSYASTMTASDVQTQAKADIKATRLAFAAAYTAATTTAPFLPVGALIDANS